MADGDLQSIIAGTDPTAAQQLQAMNAENQLRIAQNPTNYADQGIFGGLARQMALGQAGATLGGIMPDIVSQKQAAAPGLLRAMASPDPWLELLNDPNAGPVEKSMLAYGPGMAEAPANVALRQAEAALQRRYAQNAQGGGGPIKSGAPAGGGAATPGGFAPGFNPYYPRPAAATPTLANMGRPPIAASFAAAPPPIMPNVPFFGR